VPRERKLQTISVMFGYNVRRVRWFRVLTESHGCDIGLPDVGRLLHIVVHSTELVGHSTHILLVGRHLEMNQQSTTNNRLSLEKGDLRSTMWTPNIRGSGPSYTGNHVASFSTDHKAQQRSSPTPRHITYSICSVTRFCIARIEFRQPPRVPSAQSVCFSRGMPHPQQDHTKVERLQARLKNASRATMRMDFQDKSGSG
jgi:hypothetical protein